MKLIKDVLSRYRRVVVCGELPASPLSQLTMFHASSRDMAMRVVPRKTPSPTRFLGVKAYKSLEEVPPPVEIVDVFPALVRRF
jgi:predicted CoA-binding protein